MKYAGVVVLYNPNKEEVIHNINSYIEYLDILYVMDNSDESHEGFFKNIDKIQYIPNYQNLGIAEALNIPARKAIENGVQWLLTMDQDSCFDAQSLLALQKYIEEEADEKTAIVSPFHNTVRSDGYFPKGIDKPIIVMTSGNFINLESYQKVGGFKEWLFIDCVDFDYCLNLIRHGYEIIQVNKSILHHELGETIKKKVFGKTFFVDNHNYIRRYYIVRNRHYIYDEYKDEFPQYCEAEIRCTRKEVIKIVLYEKDKIKKLRYMYKGYRHYKQRKVGSYYAPKKL